MLTIAYNRAGLLEAMNGELDALARENPDSAAVATLAASLRTVRR